MADAAPQPATEPHDIRPQVARPSGQRSVWIFATILAAMGGGIFYALQMNRMDIASKSNIVQESASGGMIASPSELAIPPQYGSDVPVPGYGQPLVPQLPPGGAAMISPVVSAAPITQQGSYGRVYQASPRPEAPTYPQVMGPGVAYQAPMLPLAAGQDGSAGKPADTRVHAGRLAGPSTTVPQGSVIQAVMETALDSTRAGFARAVISRDVMSFDGTRVLIPKGSKLFGAYQADVSLGQKRALIQWRRLTCPDGTIIDIDSPSADPLGRAGVKGKVNTHFFERFSGAILQSMLDLGVRAATTEATGDTVIVGLPGSTTQAASIQNPNDIKPTLKIPQGASVSVMVARDLDFSSVEG